MLCELSNKIELSNQPGMPPGFQYAGHKFCFLNSGFDVEIDSVTYHLSSLSSEFSGRGEMGAVIDMIELERNRKSLV